MPPKPTAYFRPQTLTEAQQLLAQPDTKPLGGGILLLAAGAPYALVDLQDLGLTQITHADGQLHAGAMVTLTQLMAHLDALPDATDSPAAFLQHALHLAGPNTFRNAATLGGITARRPADSELLAALLALDVIVQFAADDTMPLTDYLAAAERPSKLITGLQIPWQDGVGSSHRVARTPRDTPIVSISGWQPAQCALRLAATGLGARPFRLTAAETAVADGVTEQTMETAVTATAAANQHPGDFRGDTAYRAEMGVVLTRRVLADLTA